MPPLFTPKDNILYEQTTQKKIQGIQINGRNNKKSNSPHPSSPFATRQTISNMR